MATTYTSSSSGSKSKSYASGKVSDKTQKNKDKYSTPYQQSDVVNKTYQQLQNLQKPGAFSSPYQTQMDNLYSQYANRDKFTFDVNESALYEQLKNQYASLGKLAMQDAMGQAASMTGGYGSSYAQTAGQQTYQNYMQQLQEQLPSLYQMELDRYNQEGNDIMSQYGMAKDMYDTDYGKYRDEMGDYFTERDYLNALYQNERAFDYGKHQDERNYWTDQYWNEKNAETTTESSSWSKSSSVSDSGSDAKKTETKVQSKAPASWKFADQVLMEANKKKSKEEAINYLVEIYEAGAITEENLNYFLDEIEGR